MNKPKAVKGLPAVLFYLVQLTWGLPVNIIGFLVFLVCKLRKCPTEKYCNSFITYVKKKNFGGLSMGLFIFIRDEKEKKVWLHDTKIHEYGHTIQALVLGVFYWIIVGIPSAIWCNLFAGYRKKNNVSYYKLYCESWANNWGQKWSGEKQIETRR
ncbi:MAG TPA: hypothetical protein GXZ23_06595 [Clostridiales bacterium]|nr:hypothetical protein [Clostridiales bacterium]